MKKYTITILSLLTFLTIVEFSMVMPLGPQIADKFGVSRNGVTVLFIGYTLMGLITPIFGYLSDKFGLKKIILVNVIIFTFGAFVNSFTTTAVGFFIGRSIIGIGHYAVTSLVIVYSSKIIDYKQLGIVSGIYKFAFAGAMFAAPIIGSFYIKYFSISALYLTIAITSAVILLMLLPLKEVSGDNDISLQDIKKLIKKPDVLLMMLASFMLAVPSVFFFNYLSTHLQDIGYTVDEASSMFSIVAAGSIVAAILIILFSDKIGKLRMTRYGIYLSTLSILGFLFELDMVIVISGVLFGIGYDTAWGLFFPVASKMYDIGVNSYITILSMAMSLAGVCTNSLAPLVMERWGFTGNIIVSFTALSVSITAYYLVTKKHEVRLN